MSPFMKVSFFSVLKKLVVDHVEYYVILVSCIMSNFSDTSSWKEEAKF